MNLVEYPLLIQVVPRLTPARCGISDHVLTLAGELKAAYGIGSAFAVLNSRERFEVAYPCVYPQVEQLPNAFESLAKGRPAAMLVHVSGYGYSADGVPARLAGVLARLKVEGRIALGAYFHELYATGAPWRSAFWHSRRQKNAVRQIAAACDLLVTNTQPHADWLEDRAVGRRVRVLSVFSQAGESQWPLSARPRQQVMAIFGLGSTRQRAYRQLAGLGAMLRDLGVEELWDIGPEIDLCPEVDGVPVKRLGLLEPAEISARLSGAQFGYIWYPPFCLGKSGVFAAYCANGVIPVIGKPFRAELDGLKDGVNVFSPNTARRARGSELDQCSRAAWQWYSGHRLRVHAETYRQWLAQQQRENATAACRMAASAEA